LEASQAQVNELKDNVRALLAKTDEVATVNGTLQAARRQTAKLMTEHGWNV